MGLWGFRSVLRRLEFYLVFAFFFLEFRVFFSLEVKTILEKLGFIEIKIVSRFAVLLSISIWGGYYGF